MTTTAASQSSSKSSRPTSDKNRPKKQVRASFHGSCCCILRVRAHVVLASR